MSASTPALLVAAAGVGFGHAVLPDHWAPLAVMGRARKYSASRVTRISAAAGIAHVMVSVILGAIIILVGSQFRSSITDIENALVGGILIATGVGFAILELSGRGHHHGPGGHTHDHGGHSHEHGGHSHEHGGHSHTHGDHSHDHDGHSHDQDHHPSPDGDYAPQHSHAETTHGHSHSESDDSNPGLLAAMIPFGAAASPDLTILPVFLAAAAAGTSVAVGSLLVFALVTIGTIVTLTLVAFSTGRLVRGEWIDRWGNNVTAGVLVLIGLLVITGTI
jgi:nickel/cobalt transporter (NicO) family protein